MSFIATSGASVTQQEIDGALQSREHDHGTVAKELERSDRDHVCEVTRGKGVARALLEQKRGAVPTKNLILIMYIRDY